LESAARYKPNPEGLFAFGAPNLSQALGLKSAASWLIPGALLGAWGCWLARTRWKANPTARATSSSEREFAAGAALLVGVFFLGASYAYKLIFAVWLLPWFWRDLVIGAEKRWRQLSVGLLFAVLWFEGSLALVINLVLTPRSTSLALHTLDATLVVTQLLTWAWAACLLRPLIFFCVDRIRSLGRAEIATAVPR
jgi:hypothetical protein